MSKNICSLFGAALMALIVLAQPTLAQEKPIQLGIFTPLQLVSKDQGVSGVRLSLIYCQNTRVSGLDYGFVNRATSGVSKGVQLGFIGIVDTDFKGWQDCGVNITKGNCEGLQWGVVNYAGYVSGIQLGLVNYARSMHGLQIGFVNIIKQGGQFPVFPIVNWSF